MPHRVYQYTIIFLLGVGILAIAFILFLHQAQSYAGKSIPEYQYQGWRDTALRILRISGYIALLGSSLVAVRVLQKIMEK